MRTGISRRQFLRTSVGSLAAVGLGVPGWSGCGSDDSGSVVGAETLAVTMWEFSWLVRRSGDEAEYADWDRVLDELALRGYNCIRLDAFPHLIARGPQGDLVERFTILPQTPLFFWGNHEPVEVEPRRSLLEFLGKVKARGMKVGLSTWFNDDTLHRAQAVVTPEDYARVWLETLDFLDEEGLHDIIAWVDLCNEFPLGKWAKGAYPVIFDGADPANLLPVLMPWSNEVRCRIQGYFDEAIPPLKSAYPELRYTFSLAGGFVGHNVADIDTSNFDLAEVHIWLSDDPAFSLTSGQLFLLLEFPGTLELHVNKAPCLYFNDRDRWLGALEANIQNWKDWADARGLPLITSESWGPINYDDLDPPPGDEEWDWVKDVCAEGVRMAADRGWEGICTSNFCQPHFEGMWADIAWHQNLTSLIRVDSFSP
ncbi:cellulase-like family protein [Thermodesulfobacteriota bacterium]